MISAWDVYLVLQADGLIAGANLVGGVGLALCLFSTFVTWMNQSDRNEDFHVTRFLAVLGGLTASLFVATIDAFQQNHSRHDRATGDHKCGSGGGHPPGGYRDVGAGERCIPCNGKT